MVHAGITIFLLLFAVVLGKRVYSQISVSYNSNPLENNIFRKRQ